MSIDDVIRANLMRLIEKYAGKNQRRFAEMVGIDYGLLNQIVNEHKDLGKPLIERICKRLKIRYSDFTIEADTPIITDTDEMKIIRTMRKYPEIKPEINVIAESLAQYKDKSGSDITVQKKRRTDERQLRLWCADCAVCLEYNNFKARLINMIARIGCKECGIKETVW